jgi:hypothetical protein
MVTRHIAVALCFALACTTQHAQKQKAGPLLTVDTRAWSFGTIQRGETATGRISIANPGTDTLRVSLYSTCDCLSAIPKELGVPSHGKVTVDLSYTGDEIKHHVTKTIFIDSNDPENPRLVFTVSGRVTPGKAPHLVVIPDPVPFDPAAPTYPLAVIRIENRGKEALRIYEITCFGCTSTSSRMVLDGGEEALLEVLLLPDWTDGRWLEIESNDPVQPLKKITLVELD